MSDATTWEQLGLPSARQLSKRADLPSVPATLPGGQHAAAALDLLRHEVGVIAGGRRPVVTPIGVRWIDDAWLAHVVEKREAARERYANLVVRTLEDPTEVWLAEYGGEARERFLKFWRDGDKPLLVVINIQKGNVLWNVLPMPIRSVDRQRKGSLLWKKYQ